MITYTHDLGMIYFLEPGDDTAGVSDLLYSRTPISVDSEGTGIDPYAADFRVRLVQVGSADTAYVFRPHDFPALAEGVVTTRPVMLHNATYDLLALERELGVPFKDSYANAIDTGILSRLLDPRGKKDGGIGHGLKDLAAHYLGLPVKDAQKDVLAAAKAAEPDPATRKLINKDTVWRMVADDNETYVRYAGQDVLLTSRLGVLLADLVKSEGLGWLAEFEHRVAYCLAHLQRKGMAVDVPWILASRKEHNAAYEAAEATLRDVYGVVKGKTAKSYSAATASLTELLLAAGARLTKTTDSGKLSLDGGVLKELAAQPGKAGDIARTVQAAKKAHHYGEGYLAGFLAARGHDGRVHPVVNPLAAATGRMSITNPPLQQIPKDDVTLRGAFLPDEGHVLIAADYSQMEWRVAAAITGDPNLIAAIKVGKDVHDMNAEALFGPNFTKEQRGVAKGVGLSWLYGSGYRTMMEQFGLTEPEALMSISRLKAQYPGIATEHDRLKKIINELGQNVQRTAVGRRLIVNYGHAGLNYHVQSPSRDLFAEAVVKLFDMGLGDAVRLVVHDEIILSVPKEDADEARRIMEAAMCTEFRGVPITAEAEIMGERWRK